MSLARPEQAVSRPFSEVFEEGEVFVLDGIRVVEVRNTKYGSGEMALLKIRGQAEELSIWGQYLSVQAKSAEPSDFGQPYKIIRKRIQGFAEGREVKALEPASPPPVARPAAEDDIPF